MNFTNCREHPFPESVVQPHWLYDNDSSLQAHPHYRAAKAGSKESAVELIADLALEFLASLQPLLPEDAIFVAPHAQEVTGDNAIPQVLAAASAMVMRGQVETDIVQINRVFHTGADPMERLSLRSQFVGEVVSGAQYVLVDDVTNMGGTVADLANFIIAQGGCVVAVIVLVNAGRDKRLAVAKPVLKKLLGRYKYDIQEIFSIAPQALTANEATYLIGFRTVDEIRNRLTKARKETHLRLRSKGFK